jgi:Protein of unknown function (DUF2628)
MIQYCSCDFWMPAFAGTTGVLKGTTIAVELDMAIYTVHEPPPRADELAPDPERFVFVRDGFYFWAFLLQPLWMLRHRLWLVLVGYVVVAIALQVGLRALGASNTVITVAGVLFALLIGFEAATLRRFTLARRRFRNVGIVVGDDLELAERRFFDAWIGQHPEIGVSAGSASPPAGTIGRRPPSSPGVIGLFPQPGAPR